MDKAQRPGPTHEQIQPLIRRLAVGNPLLDDEAYRMALARCPNEECREFLEDLKAAVQAGFTEDELVAIYRAAGLGIPQRPKGTPGLDSD